IDNFNSSIGSFELISKEDYNSICTRLFSDYNHNDLKSLHVENYDEFELKEMFADWLFEQGKYKRVYKDSKKILIEKLSEFEIAYENDFGVLIFENRNFSLETIINELETNVIDESGSIGDINRRTVGNGSVKAILGPNNYIKFLKDLLSEQSRKLAIPPESLNLLNSTERPIQTDFNLNSFQEKTQQSSLNFSPSLILRFIASLTSKPFVILSGLSGSGKTKIAQSFAQWICESDSQYKIVPVGADWTNREPLVGYPNGLNDEEYITPDSGVIHLLLEAISEGNENKPFFLILDEMNLSHVERYFADFLSIMESKDKMKLYTGNERISIDGKAIPQQIGWPKNVFIIGTVNIDETTYMFSPKVLDRANVIEFRITEGEIKTYLADPGVPDLKKLERQGISMAESFLKISADVDLEKNEDLSKELVLFFNQLKNLGAEFGYRSATEILQLVSKLKMLEPSLQDKDNQCLDIAIMQKLLPKLHGSRSKLVKILVALGEICLVDTKDTQAKYFDSIQLENYSEDDNVKYPISFEKLTRMYKNVLANGFTSYAEA
ncbi:MAG: hypothetical protein EOO46_20205, partial [Flavobacterium sp.]